MSERILSIMNNATQRPVQTKVTRLAYSHRIKAIEAISETEEYFYFIFYNDQFITAINTPLNKKSQLAKLFQKGITITSPHPLIDSFLTQEQTYHLKPIDGLLRPLLKKYTPQEVSLILSYFDMCIPKEKIVHTMEEYFYTYRRNGQLRLAFQILMILLNFELKNKWAQDMSNQMAFLKFRGMYDKNGPETSRTRSPLYGDSVL